METYKPEVQDEIDALCPKCGENLAIIYSKKTGKNYAVCMAGRPACDFISDVTEDKKTGKFTLVEGDKTLDINCLKCNAPLKEITTKSNNKICVCSTGKDACSFVVFAQVKDILGVCPTCKQGYVHKDKTPTGKRLRKCSVRGCTFVEWERDRGNGNGEKPAARKSNLYKGKTQTQEEDNDE